MPTGFTERERREIAGRARTFYERLDGPPNEPGSDPPMSPDAIMDEWRSRFPDEASFRDRLARDDLAEGAIREQTAATYWPADEDLPDWLDDLEALVEAVATTTPEDCALTVDAGDVPFVEVMAVVAEFARGRLPEAVATDPVTPMVDWLLSRLESLCLRPLYVEFKSFVEYHDAERAARSPDAFDDPPTEYYEQFVDVVFGEGITELCLEYPVLARFVVQVVDQWVELVTDVHRRVRSDRGTLRRRFGVDGEVTALEPLADDTHGGGKVPVRVSFETGEVVYKPRPVDAGRVYHEVLDRLDDELPFPTFATYAYVSRDDYGWMEAVDYSDPADEAAVERYYERAGATLGVAYALNFTDCHVENVIAAGDRPAVVDAETLFNPHVAPTSLPFPTEIAATAYRSILFTGLVPWSAGDPRERDVENLAANLAGLGDESGTQKLTPLSEPEVEAPNTDVMSIVAIDPTVDTTTNTPTLDGEDRAPGDNLDAVVRGFERTYETVRRLHEEGRFVSEVVPPDLVEGVENRFVFRPTVWYDSVIRSSTARDPLRDGVRFSVEMESLAVPFFDGQIETDGCWPLVEAERASLRRLDVPRFTSRIDDRTVYHRDSAVGVATDRSGYERSRRHLDRMDAADRHRQTWLLRQSFGDVSPAGPPPSAGGPPGDHLRTAAVDLFEDALDAAVETAAGDRWVSVNPLGSTFALTPVRHSLYDGRGGMALAAAALYVATGRERYRHLVDELLDRTTDLLESGPPDLPVGGTRGVGAVVYVLSTVGDLLDDESYREAALTAARSVTTARIESDDTFDVMEGTAGALLGLLAYHDRYGGESVLERAVACGDRLLEGRVPVEGHRVWETVDDTPFTGFAHGTSGIGYALARLSRVTGRQRYAAAVREALAYESVLYDPHRDNWARSPAREEYTDRWCHGRTGIALARLGIGEQLDDPALRSEASAVLSRVADGEGASVDHLCCGNFGRVDALVAGVRRGDCERTGAVELAQRCLAREAGVLSLPGHSQSFVNPTLFNGVSGIAYALVRLRRPDSIPCVLLFD